MIKNILRKLASFSSSDFLVDESSFDNSLNRIVNALPIVTNICSSWGRRSFNEFFIASKSKDTSSFSSVTRES